jgi:hypothetical protein
MFGVALLLVVSAGPAQAGSFTLTCGDSLLSGATTPTNLTVTESTINPFSLVESNTTTVVTVSPGVLGAAKCAAIATALGLPTSSVSGNTLTISGLGLLGFTVVSDNTKESNTLTEGGLGPSQQAVLIEIPANLIGTPAAGTTFGGVFNAPFSGPVTFGVTANGSQTYSQLLNNLNLSFTAATGLSLNSFVFDLGGSLFPPRTGFRTGPFDPPTVSITWDANTSLDLANFGLEVVNAPEPGTALLVGTGLLALWGFRRRR